MLLHVVEGQRRLEITILPDVAFPERVRQTWIGTSWENPI